MNKVDPTGYERLMTAQFRSTLNTIKRTTVSGPRAEEKQAARRVLVGAAALKEIASELTRS